MQQVISLGAAIDNTVEGYVKYKLHQAYVIQKIISSQQMWVLRVYLRGIESNELFEITQQPVIKPMHSHNGTIPKMIYTKIFWKPSQPLY